MRLLVILILTVLSLSGPALAQPRTASHSKTAGPKHTARAAKTKVQKPLPPYKGWGYLAEKLMQDGIQPHKVRSIFKDPRMPAYEHVMFSIEPRESAVQYRLFTHPAQVTLGRRCLSEHTAAFAQAEKNYSVDRHVLAAILLIETHCGKSTGKSTILYRLARLATINAPENLAYNLRAHNLHRGDNSAQRARRDRIIKRARRLEEMFYPEIAALLEIAERNHVDPFQIKGSTAGAFGIPQFLPSSYIKFGVDADGDGKVSLFNFTDAIASCANFLKSYGWQNEASLSEKRQVIWQYNHSDAYIDTTLKVAELLKAPPKPRRRAAKSAPQKTAPPKKKK
ncbi:MAG: lytic murein transglycosylase [Deltaproteobacteria bacterium]|nr:lytic murein transglycosylase [Deltaproteobacteria bacterium]